MGALVPPCRRVAAATGRAILSRAQAGDPPQKILVVDDEPDLVLLCRLNLKAAGYEVVSGGDGAEALEAVVRERPALVLLDVDEPRADGWQC